MIVTATLKWRVVRYMPCKAEAPDEDCSGSSVVKLAADAAVRASVSRSFHSVIMMIRNSTPQSPHKPRLITYDRDLHARREACDAAAALRQTTRRTRLLSVGTSRLITCDPNPNPNPDANSDPKLARSAAPPLAHLF